MHAKTPPLVIAVRSLDDASRRHRSIDAMTRLPKFLGPLSTVYEGDDSAACVSMSGLPA